MLEQSKQPRNAAFPLLGRRSRFTPNLDRGAFITNAAGFGLAVMCGFMAWAAAPIPAFIITLLTFGWLVVVLSLLASQPPLRPLIIVLAIVAFGLEGLVLVHDSRIPPTPMQLNNHDLKLYIRYYAGLMRETERQYRSQYDEIRQRIPISGMSQDEQDVFATRNDEDYTKAFLEEANAFGAQYLFQSQTLEKELLRRLGSRYPEALYPAGDRRRRSAANAKGILFAGLLTGDDPISNVANYLEDLSNSLP
jgi:hypothetical protein